MHIFLPEVQFFRGKPTLMAVPRPVDFKITVCDLSMRRIGSLKPSDFLVVVGISLIMCGNMLMVRKLQHGNLPINGFSTNLSKFPPLPEIRQFEGPTD